MYMCEPWSTEDALISANIQTYLLTTTYVNHHSFYDEVPSLTKNDPLAPFVLLCTLKTILTRQ